MVLSGDMENSPHGKTCRKILHDLKKWLYEEGMKFERVCDSEENFVNATSACARRAQCYYTLEKIEELRQAGKGE